MKKFLLSLFVIFLAYVTAYHTSGASEKQELFELGDSPFMYKLKVIFSDETDTTDANDLYARASDYMGLEEYELALKDYEKVLKLNPDIFYLHIDMAKAYLELKDTANAIGAYQRHIATSDYPEDAYLDLGLLYKNSGLLDSALYYLKEIKEADSENHQACYYLGELYLQKGDYETALKLTNEAIELYNYDLDYRNLRRKIYLKLERKQFADAEYQYIVSSNPNYFGSYAEQAKEAKEAGKYQEAIEKYKQALSILPDDKTLLNEKAWTYHSLMYYDSALIDFKYIAELYPDYYSYFNVAYTLDFLDSIKQSVEYYNKSIDLKDDYYLSYNNRGYEYFRLKKYKKAEADYTKSIKLKGDYYLHFYNRGLLYFKLKKYKKAITDYKMALSYSKDNKNITYDLAEAYDKAKKKSDAVYYYNEFLKLASEADSVAKDYAIKRVAKLSR